MVHHSQITILLLAGMAVFMAIPAAAVTLTYQQSNKWVAQADNTPLLQLMAAAKKGQTHFTATLPKTNRPLSLQRLLILKDILAREAGQPVVIEESSQTTKPNTLIIK